MLSRETESRLLRVFQDYADHERQVETLRQILAECPDFEPYTTFKRLDRLRKGYLTSADLVNFMDDNNVYVSNADALRLLKLLDADNDGRVNYNEFAWATLPQNNSTWKSIANSRPSYYVGPGDLLAHDVEYALSRIFEREIILDKDREVSKKLLVDRYDFYLRDAFRAIDYDNFGHVDFEALKIFFDKNGVVPYSEDMDAILRRLDMDGDDKISYREFIDAMLPSGPSYRASSYERRRTNFADDTYSSPKRTYSPYRRGVSTSPRRVASADMSMSRSFTTPTKTSPFKEDTYSTPSKTRGRTPEKRAMSPRRTQSPLRENDQCELVHSFKEQINLDRDLEGMKQDLALRPDFNLNDAFRIFDVSNRGYLTSYDLEDGLRVYGVYPSQDELYLVFKRYDSNGDGRLRFSEFTKMYVPKAREYESIVLNRTSHNADGYYSRDDVFEFETKMQFKKLMTAHLEFEVAAERLRQRLRNRLDFNIYDAFKTVDKNDNGFITMDEFADVLREWGLYASTKDLESLMDRYDQNKDGKISYSEFHSEVAPKSPTRV